MRRRYFSAAAMVLMTFSPQADLKLDRDDETRTVECKGAAVTVSGDDNILTFQGECSKLTVDGDDNTITARTITELVLAGDDNTVVVDSVARINTSGDDNTVIWKAGMGGKPPAFLNTGADNVTKQGQ